MTSAPLPRPACRPAAPLLTTRRHIDLVRVAATCCR
ncbi:putative leader peptide [Streptomyces sp. NPDC092296]